ncbi:MAG: LPXTG cell wall anchor domain-containing protein [Acidimicrobiia bacterium]
MVVPTPTTDANGDYSFTDVAVGMYRMVVDSTTLPAGMVGTYDLDDTLDDMTEISIVAGDVTSDVDFGYVSGFNLILTKTVNGDATIGGTLNYVLVVTNEGPAPTTGVVTVTDTVPSALTVESVDATGWSCGVVGQTVDCDLVGDLAAGGTAFITITTTVGGSAGENIVNIATVTVDGPINEMDVSDNTDSVGVTIGELPHTGADLFGFALLGVLLLGAGIVLFVATRRRDEDEQAQAA